MPRIKPLLIALLLQLIAGFQPAFGEGSPANLNVYPLHLPGEAPRGFAFAVTRDNLGYLWIADDIGLKRYDGYQLKSFTYSSKDPSSLGSNLIPTVYLDPQGILWASGTNLNQYHPETESFSRFEVSDGYRIWAMHRDKNNILWVAGEGFGLKGFDINSQSVIHHLFDDPHSRFIRAITPHDEDHVWIASSSGLHLLNTTTLETEQFSLPSPFEQGVNLFKDATQDNDGNVWLASDLGVIRVNPQTRAVKHFRNTEDEPKVLLTNNVVSIHNDAKGDIWIGTDKLGVQRYSPATDSFFEFPIFSNEHAFPPGAVNDIYEDKQGTLWFAVSVFGVRRITPHLDKFTVYRHRENVPDSLGFNNVLDLMEDAHGNIWIATDGGGLDKFDPKTNTFKHYLHNPKDKNSLSSNSVLALAEDADGNIWIGTWGGGLNKLDPTNDKFTHYKKDPSKLPKDTLANNNIFRIEIDDNGLIYLSMWQIGLQILNPATGEIKSYLNSGENPFNITNFSINDILIDQQENLVWLAGQNGLEAFDAKRETIKKIDLGSVTAVYDVFKQNDLLWLASSNGLIKYNILEDEYALFTTEDGLSDQFIVSIEEDEKGYLWLGSQNGLNRFNPKTERVKAYTKGDGLAGAGFNRFSHLKTRSGKMYFGGSEGITYFDPMNLPLNKIPPKIQFTKFEVYQSELKPGDYPWFKHHINHTDSLSLPYDLRDISFEFTALNLISPSDNRFKYRLLGLEDEWIEVSSERRRVRYTNLSPGKYKFQVLAANNDGIWSQSPKTIKLTIMPPWWELWYVQMLFAACAVLAIYLIFRWRLHRNIQREKQLKLLVAEKTKELNQLNTNLERRVEQRTSELSIEVEERKLAEAKLFHLAFHDQLTGLPNRSWLNQALENHIKNCAAAPYQFALFFLDGDRFKQVNDTHGHRMGDLLLVAATERLLSVLKDGEHAVRLGGDEFTVLIDEVAALENATTIAERIVDAFEQPFIIEQTNMYFRVSIGVLICDQHYEKPSQILRDADVAMYRAKESGRGIYRVFDKKMRESTVEIAQIETDLHNALRENQFYLVYQPIIDLTSHKICTFEALIRWKHPERGLIPPDKFIPIAEYLGFIMEIGMWVLEQACLQLKAWQAHIPERHLPNISVNLSSLQLGQLNLIHKIDDVFSKTGVDSCKIKMEITETALAENTKIVSDVLKDLRIRDIELMIDDFGTGYSSLSYLNELPVQTVKIDRTFINTIADEGEENSGAKEIVRATIMLAHSLKLKVVAEGIETQEQLEQLVDFNCDYGQGYLIAQPLSSADATQYLEKSLALAPLNRARE